MKAEDLITRLMSAHEFMAGQLREYVHLLEQTDTPPDKSYSLRFWWNGRYETKDEALSRSRAHLALEEEALTAYRLALKRLIDDQTPSGPFG